MRIHFETKKANKKAFWLKLKSRFVCACFGLILFTSFSAYQSVFAEQNPDTASTTSETTSEVKKVETPPEEKPDPNVEKLNSEKSANQKKLEEINRQIQNFTKQITDTQKKSSSLQNELFIYDRQIATAQLQIEGKQTQIDDTQLQIDELQKLIEQKTSDIAENKKILAQLILQLNEFDANYGLKTTVGSESLSDFLDQIQYTQNFQGKVYQLLQKIKDLKSKLEKQQFDLKIQLQNLKELQNQLQIAKESLTQQKNQKQQLLTQTRGIEKNFQKLLSASKKEQDDLQKEISDLDEQIRAKLGKKTISAKKGVLAWPMDGILTQKYGNTGFTALGYNFHNGIDIAAPAGQPIYAAADGKVINTDMSNQSFGNWVAIKHDISTKNGSSQIITLYGHMRSFKVKTGQNVSQGDIIGYEGNTGNTTRKLYGPERGYHIHFGVYDVEGFGVSEGKYSNIYGNYKVPYGYTYNPLDFLDNQ
jgi:murein DD-endopeptidase MepM/ murein hydrolase activator NlpD